MRIGIDVSQSAYENTGVANYLVNLLEELVKDEANEYVLFFSSLRRDVPNYIQEITKNKNVRLVKAKIPPAGLDFMWNRLHIIPIENFIGEVNIFLTSDWSEPPTKKAKKATILYDLIVYKFPEETDKKIISVQKKKLSWVKKETDIVFCISEATKKDAIEILGIDESKLQVIYPGY